MGLKEAQLFASSHMARIWIQSCLNSVSLNMTASTIGTGRCTPKRPSHVRNVKTRGSGLSENGKCFCKKQSDEEQTQRYPASPPTEERCNLSAQGKASSTPTVSWASERNHRPQEVSTPELGWLASRCCVQVICYASCLQHQSFFYLQ